MERMASGWQSCDEGKENCTFPAPEFGNTFQRTGGYRIEPLLSKMVQPKPHSELRFINMKFYKASF